MLRIGIIGASGYTGAELVRLLACHPEVEITVATSRQAAGQDLARIFPHLAARTGLICEEPDLPALLGRADFFFTAIPHQTAMAVVPELLAAGKKVVDLSADFRLRDHQVYEDWYQAHTAPELLAEAVYGLPELYRSRIMNARLVANPGCYPTSVLLGLMPLLRAGLLETGTLIIDSKSGTSGAGRSAQVGSLFCEVTDGFRAYKVGEHRHTPEIEQEVSLLCDRPVTLSFTPHLVPMSRGILSTIYAGLSRAATAEEVRALYAGAYDTEYFVRLCPPGAYPATQYVRGSNFCDLGFKLDPRTGRLVVLAAIDNLVKGAAGQAVQNMNLMCGFREDQGLEQLPLFP